MGRRGTVGELVAAMVTSSKCKTIRIDPENYEPVELDGAVGILRAGGVIAYPTETVYGLGADATNPHAIEKVFKIKSREAGRAISLLISDLDMLSHLVTDITDSAHVIMRELWPGPLTLVFRAGRDAPRALVSAQGKIGIRFPDHRLSRELAQRLAAPITSTSANLSGQPAACSGPEVLTQLADAIELVVDGGACRLGKASTVIDVSGETPQLLRAGAIDFEHIRHVIEE